MLYFLEKVFELTISVWKYGHSMYVVQQPHC